MSNMKARRNANMDYNSKNAKLETRRKTLMKYLFSGVIFGMLFPICAIIYELYSMNLEPNFLSISKIYSINHLIIMISTAPFFLGLFSLIAGIKQAKVREEKKELESAKKEISTMAYHDSLTGLANRALLDERLD